MAKKSKPPADQQGAFDPGELAAVGTTFAEPGDTGAEEQEATKIEPVPATLGFEIEGDLVVQAGYCTRRLDARMSPRQAAAAKFLATMLNSQGAKAPSGRASVNPDGATVETAHDAARWVFEQLANQIEEATGKDLLSDFGLNCRI